MACGTTAVSVPETKCDDCEALYSRVVAIEQMLDGYQPTLIEMGGKRYVGLLKELN